jgi:hypothetical protein
MKWRGRDLTVIETEEMYRMYNIYDYYAPEGTVAHKFWNSFENLDGVEGFWEYVDLIAKIQRRKDGLS